MNLPSTPSLPIRALERMIASVVEDIGKQDSGNHATIGGLKGELKGLNAARHLLISLDASSSERGPYHFEADRSEALPKERIVFDKPSDDKKLCDTPRTDAVTYDDGKHEHVRADFARQLERDLAAALEHIARDDKEIDRLYAAWTFSHNQAMENGARALAAVSSSTRALFSDEHAAELDAVEAGEKIYTKADAEAMCELAVAAYRKAQPSATLEPVAWMRRFEDGTHDVFYEKPRQCDAFDPMRWKVVALYEYVEERRG